MCDRITPTTTSQDYDIIPYQNGTVIMSMSGCERSLLGRRAVQRDPFGRVCPPSSDEKDSVLCCCTTVVIPAGCCVLQMVPRPASVDVTAVPLAGNQVAGDEVHRWAIGHLPWVVLEDAASLLWISSRPKLNRSAVPIPITSYDQDPCKMLI